MIGESDTGALWLVNGASLFEGCVEICYNNNWESNTIARVASRQLGFSTVGKLTIHFTCQWCKHVCASDIVL